LRSNARRTGAPVKLIEFTTPLGAAHS